MVQWIKDVITWPYRKYKSWKKRREQMKRDPFIYK